MGAPWPRSESPARIPWKHDGTPWTLLRNATIAVGAPWYLHVLENVKLFALFSSIFVWSHGALRNLKSPCQRRGIAVECDMGLSRNWLCTVIAVSAPCKRPANAEGLCDSAMDRGDRRGSSVWSSWGCNEINDIRLRRSANAVDVPWGRGRDTATSPYTPWGLRATATAYSGALVATIICVSATCTRRPRGALGDLTALSLRCRCEPAPFPRRSFKSPWEPRATASKETPRRPVEMPRWCRGAMPRCSSRSHSSRRSEFFLHAVQSPWGCHPGVTTA